MNATESLQSISVAAAQMTRTVQDMLYTSSGENELHSSDLFVMGVVNRTMSLADAIQAMYEQRNYLTAAALLRMNLDTAARLWGGNLVVDFDDYCRRVIAGEKISTFKDRDGKSMTDRYLVESMKKISSQAVTVYERTSGFVHFSGPHIYGMVAHMDDDGHVQFVIGSKAPAAADKDWDVLLSAFLHFTDLILSLVKRYSKLRTDAHTSDPDTQSESRHSNE